VGKSCHHDVLLFFRTSATSTAMSLYPDCHLYLVSPPAMDVPAFRRVLDETLAAAPVAAFQLRLKGAGLEDTKKAVQALMPVCHKHETAFILNDNPAWAVTLGCDGAHIGKDDGDVAAARKVLGERMLGVSCYDSAERAMAAGEAGADYVAFGAFYPTVTKGGVTRASIATLESWTFASTIPAVAIGGITPDNALPLIRAGAHFLAVSSAVWQYSTTPAQAVQAFHQLIMSSLS
jgi:thiamine-phosphate pyrophosphorylase